MKAHDLFKAISEIDDDLIHEAENTHVKPGIKIQRICAAAAFLIMVAGSAAIIHAAKPNKNLRNNSDKNIIVQENSSENNNSSFSAAASNTENVNIISEYVSETVPDVSVPIQTEYVSEDKSYDIDEPAAADDVTSYTNTDPEIVTEDPGADGINPPVSVSNLSGIPIDTWLNNADVIWHDSDIKGSDAPVIPLSGTSVISPELSAIMSGYPEEETIFAVKVDFSFCEEITKSDNVPDYQIIIQGFQETFNQNGLEIYSVDTAENIFYTFGTAAHFEEFICNENESFVFYPAGDIQ